MAETAPAHPARTADHVKIPTLRTPQQFNACAEQMGISLRADEALLSGAESPLAQPLSWNGRTIGNRWCTQPMEGWDGTTSGGVTEPMLRRWRRFGQSGAKLIWGGEAVAVCPDGRANPNQLLIDARNVGGLAELREALVEAHEASFGRSDDLLVGLQLTHSGRFSRPRAPGRPEPVIVYHHPVLDRRLGIPADHPVLSDAEIEQLARQFVDAAELAAGAGFQFVDVKHCHGYLGHELLSAHARPDPSAAASRTVRGSCARSSRASGPACPASAWA